MRGRNSSADLGPELREQARACSAIQQFWPKALNPGGLEAEPPAPKKRLLPNVFSGSDLADRQPRCSTPLPGRRWKLAGPKLRYQICAVTNGDCAIQVFMDDNDLACQRIAPARLLNLKHTILDGDRI